MTDGTNSVYSEPGKWFANFHVSQGLGYDPTDKDGNQVSWVEGKPKETRAYTSDELVQMGMRGAYWPVNHSISF